MNILHAIILGLVQGLAEFLPISSSGHLVLFSNLFGLESAEESNLFFDVLLHVGTLVAVCIVYRKDIAEMIREFFSLIGEVFGGKRGKQGDGSSKKQRDGSFASAEYFDDREMQGEQKNNVSASSVSDGDGVKHKNRPRASAKVAPARRLIFLLIIATLPLILVVPIMDLFDSMRMRPALVGIALLVTGVILFLSDKAPKGRKTERSATWLDALFVGICQAFAVTPGISRSGTTIAGGLFLGFDRKFAVRFSFLLSIPTVIAAALFTFIDALKVGIDLSLIPIYLTGMVVAGVSGYFAIKLLSYLTAKGKFGYFAWYCWAVGLITIVSAVVA